MDIIQERTISGKGILLVPDNDMVNQARLMTLFVDVFRRPVNEYLNFKYNPPKSFYATLIFERDSYVVREETLEYPSQSWDFSPEQYYQNLYALDCVYEGILQTFVNLGVALNLVPISVNNGIALFRHTDLFFDTIKVVCYADTAVKLSLRSKAYDFCPEQDENQPDPPPPPPDEVTEVPAGTPLSGEDGVSLPYDGSTFDDGNTEPFETDLFDVPEPPPPSGVACDEYGISITYQARLDGGEIVNTTISQTVYGEYNLDVVLIPRDDDPTFTIGIGIFAQGLVSPATVCGEYGYTQFQNLAPAGLEILSAVAALE